MAVMLQNHYKELRFSNHGGDVDNVMNLYFTNESHGTLKTFSLYLFISKLNIGHFTLLFCSR